MDRLSGEAWATMFTTIDLQCQRKAVPKGTEPIRVMSTFQQYVRSPRLNTFKVDSLKNIIRVLRMHGFPQLSMSGNKMDLINRIHATLNGTAPPVNPYGRYHPVIVPPGTTAAAAVAAAAATAAEKSAPYHRPHLTVHHYPRSAYSNTATTTAYNTVSATTSAPSSSFSSSSAPFGHSHQSNSNRGWGHADAYPSAGFNKPVTPYTGIYSTQQPTITRTSLDLRAELEKDLTLHGHHNPFYPIVKVLTTFAVEGNTFVRFGVEEKDHRQIVSRDLRVHVVPFSTSLTPEPWVSHIDVHVNENNISAIPKPWRKKNVNVSRYLTILPLDITSYITKSTLDYSLLLSFSKEYPWNGYVAVFLVRTLAVQDLVGQLTSKSPTVPPPPPAPPLRTASTGLDEEIEVVDEFIPLRCPITMKTIQVPVKGTSCTHKACFDLSTFLDYCNSQSIWNCPICEAECPYHSLKIDPYLTEILQKVEGTSNITHVMVHADNTWSFPTSFPSDPVATGLEKVATGASSSESHHPVLSTCGGKGSKKRTCVDVVELAEDDSNLSELSGPIPPSKHRRIERAGEQRRYHNTSEENRTARVPTSATDMDVPSAVGAGSREDAILLD